ncbi:hypothetical protein Agub_g15960, partial [Astrephomene gubernaculifera]
MAGKLNKTQPQKVAKTVRKPICSEIIKQFDDILAGQKGYAVAKSCASILEGKLQSLEYELGGAGGVPGDGLYGSITLGQFHRLLCYLRLVDLLRPCESVLGDIGAGIARPVVIATFCFGVEATGWETSVNRVYVGTSIISRIADRCTAPGNKEVEPPIMATVFHCAAQYSKKP